MTAESLVVTCCFCGNSLQAERAVVLAVYPSPDREESQTLYAHHRCLSQRLHASVPQHPDLLGGSGDDSASPGAGGR